ncbi:MAG: PAS domain S-box protein [Bacteroidetes bacterium]|nr:PAS domain S-box protein [Bacteroidota bacterium]
MKTALLWQGAARRYWIVAGFFAANMVLALSMHALLSAWPAIEFLVDILLIVIATVTVNLVMRSSAARLRASTEQLGEVLTNVSALINNTMNPIWSIDTSMRVVTANVAFQQLVEHSTGRPFEPGESGILTSFGPASNELFRGYYTRVLQGERFTIENSGIDPRTGVVYHGAFSFTPIVVNDEVVGAAIFAQDIGERVRHERELLSSVSRYETLMNAVSDIVWEWTNDTDSVQWSPVLRTNYGYNDLQTNGTWWIDRVHQDEREMVLHTLERTIQERVPLFTMEYRFAGADGMWHWVSDRALVQYDDAGAPVRLIGVMQDIDSLKAARQRLEEKITTLREIARFSSHNVRGPLTNIIGLLRLYNTAVPADPSNVEVVEKLMQTVNDLDKAIREMVESTYDREETL